jgi:hypothetical protein
MPRRTWQRRQSASATKSEWASKAQRSLGHSQRDIPCRALGMETFCQRSNFNGTAMVDLIAAQATIAKVAKGYRVIVEIRKGAKAYVVVNKIAASIINAEAVAKTFTAEYGVPWHTVEVLYR